MLGMDARRLKIIFGTSHLVVFWNFTYHLAKMHVREKSFFRLWCAENGDNFSLYYSCLKIVLRTLYITSSHVCPFPTRFLIGERKRKHVITDHFSWKFPKIYIFGWRTISLSVCHMQCSMQCVNQVWICNITNIMIETMPISFISRGRVGDIWQTPYFFFNMLAAFRWRMQLNQVDCECA